MKLFSELYVPPLKTLDRISPIFHGFLHKRIKSIQTYNNVVG